MRIELSKGGREFEKKMLSLHLPEKPALKLARKTMIDEGDESYL